MPAAWSGRAAASASSRVSPGMNRRTARFMNGRRGRRSFSHRFRAAHRKTRRIRFLQPMPRRGSGIGPERRIRMIGDRGSRIRPMTRFYDLDAANATVPELEGIVAVLGEQRAELVRLRDQVLASTGGGDGGPGSGEETEVMER